MVTCVAGHPHGLQAGTQSRPEPASQETWNTLHTLHSAADLLLPIDSVHRFPMGAGQAREAPRACGLLDALLASRFAHELIFGRDCLVHLPRSVVGPDLEHALSKPSPTFCVSSCRCLELLPLVWCARSRSTCFLWRREPHCPIGWGLANPLKLQRLSAPMVRHLTNPRWFRFDTPGERLLNLQATSKGTCTQGTGNST